MAKPIARFLPFDNRDPDKHVLYPMPLPGGVRAIAQTNGTDLSIHAAGTTSTSYSMKGFAPHIETALTELYHAMMSEPLPGITVNGKQKYFPGIVFDLMLHDRVGGSGARTIDALDEWSLDEEWPVSQDTTCALVLATMPLQSFQRGADDVDLWLRRSHLMRGCMKLGMANPYANPHPVLRPATLAPEDWAAPAMGCAGKPADTFWRQVDNCFKEGYEACLVLDAMQPWSVRGDHYQIINEDNLL